MSVLRGKAMARKSPTLADLTMQGIQDARFVALVALVALPVS